MPKLIKCKVCLSGRASSTKACPLCGRKNKKPIYKSPLVWTLAFMAVAGVLSNGFNEENNAKETFNDKSDNTVKNINKRTKEEEKMEEKVSIEYKEENVTTEYKTALNKAKSYSSMMNMSKKSLYEQLTSEHGEKFTVEAAQYAVDNIKANWKINALKKAEAYKETMSMSSKVIYEQLVSEHGEKFTVEEAQYAINNLK